MRVDEFLLVQEAADLVGVHRDTMRRWADTGKVTHFRSPGGQRLFRAADLQSLVEFVPKRKSSGKRAASEVAVER